MKQLWFAAALVFASVGCKKVQPTETPAPPASSESAEGAAPGNGEPLPMPVSPATLITPGEGTTYSLSYAIERHELQRVVLVFDVDGEGRTTRELGFGPQQSQSPDSHGIPFTLQASTPQQNPGEMPFHDFNLSAIAMEMSFRMQPTGEVTGAHLESGNAWFSDTSDAAMKAWIQQLIVTLPNQEVGVGSQWKANVPHPLAPQNLVEVTWTMNELTEEDADLTFESAPATAADGRALKLSGRRLISPILPIGAGDIVAEIGDQKEQLRVLWINEDE